MTGKERVLAALEFRDADRVPRFWDHFFPEFCLEFAKQVPDVDPMSHFGNDVQVVVADETPWPSRAKVVRDAGDNRVTKNGWGQVQRSRTGAYYSGLLETALPDRADPDALEFEDPLADNRYANRFDALRLGDQFIFCKTGGPYIRTTFLRVEEPFWIDIMDDPAWISVLVDRVVDHIIEIGTEADMYSAHIPSVRT